MGRMISDIDKKFLLSLKPEDITGEFVYKYLADTYNRDTKKMVKSKFMPSDTFILKRGEYFNTTDIDTTVGSFVFNKLLIEPDFKDVTGYCNNTIDSKEEGRIDSLITDALISGKINRDNVVKYKDTFEWFSKQFNSVFCGSFTPRTIKPLPSVNKAKKELLNKYKNEIADGDVITVVKIENELKDIARKELKGDPGMDLYNSGARGSFDNNYKNIAIMKGPVINPSTGKADIVASSFADGMTKEELGVMGNSIVTGEYAKAVGTQDSGYLVKQLMAAYQSEVLDEPGTDCGTKLYTELLVDDTSKSLLSLTNIMVNGKPVLLTPDNIQSYYNTKVKVRNPSMCKRTESGNICSVCAGRRYYDLGIRNIGLTSTKTASTMLNLSMKKFHDSTTHIKTISLDNIFI